MWQTLLPADMHLVDYSVNYLDFFDLLSVINDAERENKLTWLHLYESSDAKGEKINHFVLFIFGSVANAMRIISLWTT